MQFDKKYKVYTWKNGMLLLWVINPGLAINELILGQRIPKVSLLDRTSDKPRVERTFVPCPHCGTLHDGRTWAVENGTAFKNWFGLYCPSCGKVIPCLINVASFILLALTFPVWGWFKKALKARWLEKQPGRYEHINIGITPNPYDKRSWAVTGLTWGMFMYLMMIIAFPLLIGEKITWKMVWTGIPLWAIAGLGFGYTMKVFTEMRGRSVAPSKKRDAG